MYQSLLTQLNSTKEMIYGMLKFRTQIEKGEAGCIKQILRIKNGFKEIKQWDNNNNNENKDNNDNDDDLTKYKYCDIIPKFFSFAG